MADLGGFGGPSPTMSLAVPPFLDPLEWPALRSGPVATCYNVEDGPAPPAPAPVAARAPTSDAAAPALSAGRPTCLAGHADLKGKPAHPAGPALPAPVPVAARAPTVDAAEPALFAGRPTCLGGHAMLEGKPAQPAASYATPTTPICHWSAPHAPNPVADHSSFAQVLLHSFPPPALPLIVHAPATTDMGEPAAFFSPDEINTSCKPLDLAIIARTPQGRPPFNEIRSHLSQRFRFKMDFLISAMDARHLLIRFQDKEDYLQVLLRDSLHIQGRPFWFFKWTIHFSPSEDSPIVPVWTEFPGLPANFYNMSMLCTLAGSIGSVLKVDRNTLSLARTHAARVNVQLDISKKLPQRIWVGLGADGYWQPVVYPDLPLFCPSCRRIGHGASKCRKNPPPDEVNRPPEEKATQKSDGPPARQSNAQQMWRAIPFADQSTAGQDPHQASSSEITPTHKGCPPEASADDMLDKMQLQKPVCTAEAKPHSSTPEGDVSSKSAITTATPWTTDDHADASEPPSTQSDPVHAAPPAHVEHTTSAATRSPSHLAVHQVLEEMPHTAETDLTKASDPPHATPTEPSILDSHKAQMPTTPTHAAPTATGQQHGGSETSKSEDMLLDDPHQFAQFLRSIPTGSSPSSFVSKSRESAATSSGTAAQRDPVMPRPSFAEALRKKSKRGGAYITKKKPPPPCYPPAATLVIAPNRPRTRSTTVLDMNSDGEYDYFSESED